MLSTRHGVLLARETSFHIGGAAREYHVPGSVEALAAVLDRLRGRRPFVLGGGCNTLFPDSSFERPVVSTERLRRLEVGDHWIRAEAGVRIDALIRTAIEVGLGGLEGFVGIPGTVGGAVAMNAGGSGWSFGERVRGLGVVPYGGGPPLRLGGRDIPWGYRSWNVPDHVVAWVELELVPGPPGELRRRAVEFLRRKNRSQPLGEPSAGCVFKNPPAGAPAARLIDSLGLKGARRGGAMVSPRHANFIVNRDGQATAADVLALLEEVRGRVQAAYGIRLETEIVIAGEA